MQIFVINLPEWLCRIRLCTTYIAVYLAIMQANAQPPAELISSYSKEEYLGDTQNWSVLMDEHGMMYFGNNRGVMVFDGQNWEIFRLPNRTFVRSLAERSQGGIYVGGQNEFGFFPNAPNREDEFVSLRHLVPDEFRDFEDVWKIFASDEGTFFCTEKAIFKIRDSICSVISPAGGRFENFFFVNGRLLVQELRSGLYQYKGEELVPVSDDPRFFNKRISVIFDPGEKGLHLIMLNGDQYLIGENEITELIWPASSFLKENKVYTAQRLKDGDIFIGTTQNGAVLLDSIGNLKKHWNKGSGLLNNTVLSLFEDPQGNVWLGLDNGIALIELNSPFSKIDRFNGVEGTGYAALSLEGQVFLGTNLGLYTRKEDTEDFELLDRTKGQVWSMQKLDDGFVLNTHDGAWFYKDGALSPVSDVHGSWKMIETRGKEGFLLQGAYDGFYLYERADNPFMPVSYLDKMKGFDESSRIFEEDEKGYIWVSHAYRGLFRLKPDYEGRRFTEVRKFGEEEGLPADLYITVSKIRGELVFATPEGMFSFDPVAETFQEHAELSDLLGRGKRMQRIVEDETGQIWFSTDSEFGTVKILNSGLFNDVEVIRFNKIQDDLVDGFEEVFSPGKGMTYIPMEDGFYRFDRKASIPSEFPHSLVISRIFVTSFGDSLLYANGQAPAPEVMELNPDHKDLRFEFTMPVYGALNGAEYQYKLENYDKGWSNWTTSTFKDYGNLDPGDYKFVVRARDSFGKITPEATFGFTLLPPWYASNPAKLVLGFIFLVLMGTLLRYVARRESKKAEEVKRQSIKTIAEKEKEFRLEKEKSQSEIIRLRNEKLRAEVSHKNAELASTTMHLLQKSEILQKIKKDLADIAKNSEDGVKQRLRQIGRSIEEDVRLDKNWERFEAHFDQVHKNFFKNLRAKYPQLTPKDQKLCAYLRMNLATKEIAPLLNISVRGVEISRYRLRKKLGLDSDTNLVSFIMEI